MVKKRAAGVVVLIVIAVVAITLVRAFEEFPEIHSAARALVKRTMTVGGIAAAVAGVIAVAYGASILAALGIAAVAFGATGAYDVTAGFFGLPQLPGRSGPIECPPGMERGTGGIACVQIQR